MAVSKFTDALIFLGAYNVSGKHNSVEVSHNVELQDITTFGAGTRQNMPALLNWQASGEGFWEVGLPAPDYGDQTLFSRIGAAGTLLTVAPANADLGVAYFMNAAQASLSFFGEVGSAPPFSLEHAPTGYGCRGVIGLQPTLRSGASGNGSGYQLGATISATQKLVAGLHVVQFTGSTLDVVVESDVVGFGSPTSRIAFTQAAGITSEWKELAGPIATDDYLRVSWTFTGTNFTALVVFGVVSL